MCPNKLSVTMDQLSEFTGIYNYDGELNGAPYYAHESGNGYLYSKIGSDGQNIWHIYVTLDSIYAAFYSVKTNCPQNAIIWYDSTWIVLPGFNVNDLSQVVVCTGKAFRYFMYLHREHNTRFKR